MDIKVVIHVKEGHALVGVQQSDTDPVVEPVRTSVSDLGGDGALAEALRAVPGVLERARGQWAASPRHPAYQGPPVPPPATPPGATPAPQRAQRQAQRGSQERQVQQSMF